MRKCLYLLFLVPLLSLAWSMLDSETLWEFMTEFWFFASQVVIWIAILAFIVWSMFYMVSWWDDQKANKAKSIIRNSIISIIFVVWAWMIRSQSTSLTEGLWTDINGIFNVFSRIQTLLYSLIGIIVFLTLLYSWSLYLSSQGDEEKIDKAKNSLKVVFIWAILALNAVFLINYLINNLT